MRHELEHLRSCVLDGLAAARVGAILEGLSAKAAGLRAACWQEGVDPAPNRGNLKVEELKALLQEKLLSILPPIAFQALLEQHASPAVQAELADYGDTPVAAREAGKVKELLSALRSDAQREMVRRVASAWGIGTRDSRGQTRGVESFKSELCGACIRFLKETPEAAPAEEASGSRAVAPEMVGQSVEQVAAVACSERAVAPGMGEVGHVLLPQAAVARGPTTLDEALRWIEEHQVVPLKRMSGKRQAVGVIPPELRGLYAGTVTKKEQVPSMLLAGCKEKRKHGRRVVRPSTNLATMEAHRGALERFRKHLQLDVQCWGVDVTMKTPQTLDAFAESLKDVEYRKSTPFASDFREVCIPSNWDGQHVLRRMAIMELENASVVARRDEVPLLDGPLVMEVMGQRGEMRERRTVESFDMLVDALEGARQSMPDQAAWFQSAWGVREKTHLQTLVNEFDTFLTIHQLRDLWTTASVGTAMVWVGWFAILQFRDKRQPRPEEVVTESRGLLKGPAATYVLSERMDGYVFPAHFKREAQSMAGWGTGGAVPEELLPVLTAPRVCELCGDGFLTWCDLGTHVEKAHVNWAEYRKRVFWHAQHEQDDPSHALPLSWVRKRQILGNATTSLVSAASVSGDRFLGGKTRLVLFSGLKKTSGLELLFLGFEKYIKNINLCELKSFDLCVCVYVEYIGVVCRLLSLLRIVVRRKRNQDPYCYFHLIS